MAFRHATCSSSSSSSSSSEARGKGVAPEAGPWHGAAGLRVKPERAALQRRRRLVAIAVIATANAATDGPVRSSRVHPRPSSRSAGGLRSLARRIGAEVDEVVMCQTINKEKSRSGI